jgi:hypothetical protein
LHTLEKLTETSGRIPTGAMDSWALSVSCHRSGDSGLVSLAVGTLGDSAKWAGIIGALTSVATILSQQLNCVKAINWHQRNGGELDGILLQLLNESQLLPTEAELAEMSTELRAVRIKMLTSGESHKSTAAELG